ncbi:MAG: glycosyltransferase family 4 protein [Gammaproteobacteria bacterium]
MATYKVALVSDWYYPKAGGIEYSINSLARNLRLLGHKVHIITRTRKGYNETELQEGIPVLRFAGAGIGGRLISPKAFGALRRHLMTSDYDIIHVHGLDSPMAMAALFFSRRASLPTVTTNHSLVGNISIRCPVLSICRFFLKASDVVIAVSSAVRKESRLITGRPVYLVPNGVDSSSPNGAQQGFQIDKKGRLIIASVSRMTKKKGVDDLVQIAPRLLQACDKLLFLMIGEGPQRVKLERRVGRLGIARHFLFTGQISRATVLTLLEQADIFVLPSKREAFGIAILEAFSKALPVVARNHSGVSDIIDHNRTGLLADDADELAEHLQSLIANSDLCRTLARAAEREVIKYQWIDIAKRVESIYGQIIREKRHSVH